MDNLNRKIGIVTFHRAKNFGAMLQAYALQESLKKDYFVNIIDYRSKEMDAFYYYPKYSLKYFIKISAKMVLRTKDTYLELKRDHNFSKFSKKYFKLSKEYDAESISNANYNYDCFVSGSDQVWNPHVNFKDKVFYLSFADKNKRNSYAASLGTNNFSSEELAELKNDIKDFKNFLIREQDGIDIVNKLLPNKKTNLVLDPVFLLSKDEWIKKLNLKQENKKDYILVYYIAKPTNSTEFAYNLAKETGLELVYLNPNHKDFPKNMKIVNSIGPREFVEYIMNAKYIVTTSFHGLSLGLIFNKKVFFEKNMNKINNNSRLENLINLLNVGNLEIKDSKVLDFNKEEVDWNKVNKIIQDESMHSLKLLKESLDE